MIKPRIVVISAKTANNVIGCENSIPWKAKDDMRAFKVATTGHIVIIGKRTFESLGNKPLPNRYNVVLTRSVKNILRDDTGTFFAPDIETAIHHATRRITEQYDVSVEAGDLVKANFWANLCTIFIIGGNSLYAYGMEIADEMIITELDTSSVVGDTYFPTIETGEWDREVLATFLSGADNDFDGEICRYSRINTRERGTFIDASYHLSQGHCYTRRAWRNLNKYIVRIPSDGHISPIPRATEALAAPVISACILSAAANGLGGQLLLVDGGLCAPGHIVSDDDRAATDWVRITNC